MLDLRTASEVFCESFAFARSLRHPYLLTHHGPLLVMQDGPRQGKNPHYRVSEVVSPGVPVNDVLEGIASLRPRRYFLSALQPGDKVDEVTKSAYKARGYRLMRTEPMMVADTSETPVLESEARVRRVETADQAEALALAVGRPQIGLDQLEMERPVVRQYYAELGGEIVGWVKSVHLRADHSWVSNLFVSPDHRRKGIAKALLSQMLRDDREHGAKLSVLLATHAGAKLYPSLGYEQIGMLHLFSPPKKVEDR